MSATNTVLLLAFKGESLSMMHSQLRLSEEKRQLRAFATLRFKMTRLTDKTV